MRFTADVVDDEDLGAAAAVFFAAAAAFDAFTASARLTACGFASDESFAGDWLVRVATGSDVEIIIASASRLVIDAVDTIASFSPNDASGRFSNEILTSAAASCPFSVVISASAPAVHNSPPSAATAVEVVDVSSRRVSLELSADDGLNVDSRVDLDSVLVKATSTVGDATPTPTPTPTAAPEDTLDPPAAALRASRNARPKLPGSDNDDDDDVARDVGPALVPDDALADGDTALDVAPTE
jgi:hypothetical protein